MFSDTFAQRHDGVVYEEDSDIPASLDDTESITALSKTRLRVTRGGALTAQYRFALRAGTRCEVAVKTLTAIRRSCAQGLADYINGLYPTGHELADAFAVADTRNTAEPVTLSGDSVTVYSLLLIENFRGPDGTLVPPADVTVSPELAGLINHASWYKAYGTKNGEIMLSKEIGYREDELYIADRTCLAIVNDRYWLEERFISYLDEVALLLEHYISRSIVLRGLLQLTSSNLDGQSRLETLSLLVDLRTVLGAVEQSLITRETIDQGFTRNLARRVGEELELPGTLSILEKRCANLLQRVELEDAIESATRSVRLASWNNALQTTALIVALIALAVSILLR